MIEFLIFCWIALLAIFSGLVIVAVWMALLVIFSGLVMVDSE